VAWAVWISKATGFKRSKEIGSGSDAGPFCVSYVRGRLHTGSNLFRGAADDGIAAGEPTECFNPTAVITGSSVAQGGTCRRRGDATIIQKFGHVAPDLGRDSGPVGCAKHVNSRLPVNSAVYPNLGQVDAPPQLTRFAGIGISTSGEDRVPAGLFGITNKSLTKPSRFVMPDTQI
jgi:hypothetical protein